MPSRLRPSAASLLIAFGMSWASSAAAFSFGSGTCEASADGSFMPWKTHHPGVHGDFVLRFSRADYLPGETLRVTLAHAGGDVFNGFLLYAQTDALVREGLFTPIPGTTLLGALPVECSTPESAAMGPTITHDQPNAPEPVRQQLALAWTAPAVAVGALTFRALVLRADPMAQSGTDFYEVTALLPMSPDGVFRDAFESVP